jgi:hypothetical protein
VERAPGQIGAVPSALRLPRRGSRAFGARPGYGRIPSCGSPGRDAQ